MHDLIFWPENELDRLCVEMVDKGCFNCQREDYQSQIPRTDEFQLLHTTCETEAGKSYVLDRIHMARNRLIVKATDAIAFETQRPGTISSVHTYGLANLTRNHTDACKKVVRFGLPESNTQMDIMRYLPETTDPELVPQAILAACRAYGMSPSDVLWVILPFARRVELVANFRWSQVVARGAAGLAGMVIWDEQSSEKDILDFIDATHDVSEQRHVMNIVHAANLHRVAQAG